MSSKRPSVIAVGWVNSLIEKCSRITSTGRFIPELDGLRALAIGLVFVQHLWETLPAQARPGGGGASFGVRLFADAFFGVELFFVISGFILALPFASCYAAAGPRVSWKAYYLRRLSRLEPPYILHLVLVATVLLLIGHSLAEVGPHLFASLFYISNVLYGQFPVHALNSVTWSLEIEVQFYLLAPLFGQVFRLSRRFRTMAISLGALLAFGVRQVLEWRFGHFPLTLLTYIPYFAVGFLLAETYAIDWREESPSRAGADFVAFVAWMVLLFVFQIRIPCRTLIVAGGLYVAVGASLQSNFIKRSLANRVVRTIGGMCYSIYLLHLVLLRWFVSIVHLPVSRDSAPGMIIAILVFGLPVLGISAVYFVLVEKPCMQREWWRRYLPLQGATCRSLWTRTHDA